MIIRQRIGFGRKRRYRFIKLSTNSRDHKKIRLSRQENSSEDTFREKKLSRDSRRVKKQVERKKKGKAVADGKVPSTRSQAGAKYEKVKVRSDRVLKRKRRKSDSSDDDDDDRVRARKKIKEDFDDDMEKDGTDHGKGSSDQDESIDDKAESTDDERESTDNEKESTDDEKESTLDKEEITDGEEDIPFDDEEEDDDGDDEMDNDGEKKRRMTNRKARCLSEMPDAKHPKDSQRSKVSKNLMTDFGNVTFSSIGGLSVQLEKVKEMVILPLLYPEYFKKIGIDCPKGVLFHGPPGTGKTLVARALANEYSHGDVKVSFLTMRTVDCLSKWFGESEKRLQRLFDEAYEKRPSIIFFDEFDGLAPSRRENMEQCHNSIVTTLLSLMDGLNDRREVILIASTNKIDLIDPAFRRPGRFDRELFFPLPSHLERIEILKIFTKNWRPKVPVAVISEVAADTVGYSGADLKSLCTEASLIALRQKFPQIFTSNRRLDVDFSALNVTSCHFADALSKVVTSSQRSANRRSISKPLSRLVRPLLSRKLEFIKLLLDRNFPADRYQLTTSASGREDFTNILNKCGDSSFSFFRPFVHRSNCLIFGKPGSGHSVFVLPAVLRAFENLPIHVIDLSLVSSSAYKSLEESVVHVIEKCQQQLPSVLCIMDLDELCRINPFAQVISTVLKKLDSTLPILVLASCTIEDNDDIFNEISPLFENHVEIEPPNDMEKRHFFSDLLQKTVRHGSPMSDDEMAQQQESIKTFEKQEQLMAHLHEGLHKVLSLLLKDTRFSNILAIHDEGVTLIKERVDDESYQSSREFLTEIDFIADDYHMQNLQPGRIAGDKRGRALELKKAAKMFVDVILGKDALVTGCESTSSTAVLVTKKVCPSKRFRRIKEIGSDDDDDDENANASVRGTSETDFQTQHASDINDVNQASDNLAGQAPDINIAEQPSDINMAEHPSDINIAEQTSDINMAEHPSDINIAEQASDINIAGQPSAINIADQESNSNLAGQTSDTNLARQTSDTNLAHQTSDVNLELVEELLWQICQMTAGFGVERLVKIYIKMANEVFHKANEDNSTFFTDLPSIIASCCAST